MLPVHPGMDNRKIQLDEIANQEGRPLWTIERRDGKTLRDYLRSALTQVGVLVLGLSTLDRH